MSSSSGFLTREQLLNPPPLDEEIVSLAGFGDVLCGELSGDQRATINERQTKLYQEGEVNIKGYQHQLLALGLLDPESPEGARTPLLREGDIPGLMHKLGGSKLRDLIAAIERLSGMGVNAVKVADETKGNSEAPASAAGTSE